ncbi:MAG: TIGR00730 family Rossman fold protein [Candidatus Ancaeobacter aquaticus]|nr:TIGR00730 family Rossman fold protein [Candidatus Ancaeobacter aquaticus]
MKSICVYCSSSDALPDIYYTEAARLGKLLAGAGYRLIYGGGSIGLMGVLGQTTQKHNGKITGIIPKHLAKKGIMYEHAEEMIETHNLRDRKELMEQKAHAFIALPGGIGTLEEIAEIITLRQLHCHSKPIAIINTNNFYHDLLKHLNRCYKENFMHEGDRQLYYVANNSQEALTYISERIER